MRNGFTRSAYDPYVYLNHILYLLLYVDDILIVGKCINEVEKMKMILRSEFEMTDLGNTKKILGIEIRRKRSILN